MKQRRPNLIVTSSLLLLGVLTTMAYLDHFVIFGDSVKSMGEGRAYAVPIWGQWIAPRVVGDFFPPVLFNAYATVVGPLFGVRHIADVYSSFMAVIFALNFLMLAGAAFIYARLFIALQGKHFLPFALVFFLFYFSRATAQNITLYFAYDLPFALAIWFAYPFVAHLATGSDPLRGLKLGANVTLVAVGAYFVAFSITNAYIFAATLIGLCCLVLCLPQTTARDARFMDGFLSTPMWFKFGSLFVPIMTAVAILFDVTSRRFTAERNKTWSDPAIADFPLLGGVRHLLPDVPALLLWIALLTLPLFTWHLLSKSRLPTAAGATTKRALLTVGVLIGTALIYYGFLFALTRFSERNYFAYGGFPKPLLYLTVLFISASSFTFASRRALGIVLVPLVAVIALTGAKMLVAPPSPRVLEQGTQAQVRLLFSSMYMSYCHNSDTVPVYLNQPRYPFVPIPSEYERNWFGQSFARVFSQFVVNEPAPRYLPSFYAVDSVDALLEKLRESRDKGTNRCAGLTNSPYYIDLGP